MLKKNILRTLLILLFIFHFNIFLIKLSNSHLQFKCTDSASAICWYYQCWKCNILLILAEHCRFNIDIPILVKYSFYNFYLHVKHMLALYWPTNIFSIMNHKYWLIVEFSMLYLCWYTNITNHSNFNLHPILNQPTHSNTGNTLCPYIESIYMNCMLNNIGFIPSSQYLSQHKLQILADSWIFNVVPMLIYQL
jgi:hypothetical protein